MGKSHQSQEPTTLPTAAPAQAMGPPAYQQPAGNAARQAQLRAAKPDLSVQPSDIEAALKPAAGTPPWAGAMPANLCHSVPDATKPISPTNCAPAPRGESEFDRTWVGKYVNASKEKGGPSIPGTPLSAMPVMDGFTPAGATINAKGTF